MPALIALLGTFETKSEELTALSDLLKAKGLEVLKIDLSLAAGGSTLPGDEKVRRMIEIAKEATEKIVAANPTAAVAIGGGTGSEMAMRAMQPLPVAMPKFMITTLPFDPRNAVADNAITLIPTLCDIQGMNAVLRSAFARTAAMVAGAANEIVEPEAGALSVAVTLLGVTQKAGDELLRQLRANGYETSAFHAAGYGGAALTRFAEEGLFCGMIDMTVHEIVRMHVAGSHVPMPGRFTSTAHLPRVVLPGAMNFFDAGPYDGMPPEFRDRANYRHSSYFTHVKLRRDEIVRAAQALAADLNQSTAPCEVLVPMGGFSSEDRIGGAIEDLELRECAAEIFETEARAYAATRLPFHINDPETATEAVSRLMPHLTAET